MNDAITLSREILNAHPTGVRSLFQRYGIGAEPTPRSIVLATAAFGQAFVTDLYALSQSGVNNFIGSEEDYYKSDYYYITGEPYVAGDPMQDINAYGNAPSGSSAGYLDAGLINYKDSTLFPAGYTPTKYDMYGNPVNSTVAPTKKNTSFADFTKSFNNILGLIGNTVSAGANIYNTVKTGQTQQTTNMTTAQAQAAAQRSAAQAALDKEASDAKNKQILIVGGVLLAVIVVGIFLFRRR